MSWLARSSLTSHGNSAVRSISAARGAIRSSARIADGVAEERLLVGQAVGRSARIVAVTARIVAGRRSVARTAPHGGTACRTDGESWRPRGPGSSRRGPEMDESTQLLVPDRARLPSASSPSLVMLRRQRVDRERAQPREPVRDLDRRREALPELRHGQPLARGAQLHELRAAASRARPAASRLTAGRAARRRTGWIRGERRRRGSRRCRGR